MILNTVSRTDTVQYYTKWLLKRFQDGYVLSQNPLFPNKVARYELTPDKVNCVVFFSKNYEPILNDLTSITIRFNTYFHYTITAYGKDIEPGVPSIKKSIKTLKKLSAIVGEQRVAWQYAPLFGNIDSDEILFTTVSYPELIPSEFLSIPEVSEAMTELTVLSADKEFRAEYDAREMQLNDERAKETIALEKGEKIGIEKGENNKARDVAINAIKMGFSIEQICKLTELTEDQINEIIKKQTKN